MSTIHILFENEAWLPPLVAALQARDLPHEAHLVTGGHLDLAAPPRDGVFINRMSPSAHTRDHQGGVRFLQQYLAILEAHGRKVINGSRAFALEVSKVAQDIALRRASIRTPHTVAVIGGVDALVHAARQMPAPFITKDNQGGKGLGVRLFHDLDGFDAYVQGPDFVEGPDGVTLLQQYIEPADGCITRVEIVGGQLQYAIRSSTAGGFELCPADGCALDDAFCPVGPDARFTLAADLTADDPLVQQYIQFMADNRIDVAGIEFVEDRHGVRYTYDVNGTTNYNGDVEAAHGLSGMAAVAALAEDALRALDQVAA